MRHLAHIEVCIILYVDHVCAYHSYVYFPYDAMIPTVVCVLKVPRRQRVLMWLLAVVESTEVMLEVTSELALGEPGKWAVVILVQCLKAVLRAVLVFHIKSGLLTLPPVPSPDRKQAKVATPYIRYTLCVM